jgi:hypothetical protein
MRSIAVGLVLGASAPAKGVGTFILEDISFYTSKSTIALDEQRTVSDGFYLS